jgi:translation initiation factor IF-3
MSVGNSNYRGRRPRVFIPLNENIRVRRLRVIDEAGVNLGEMSREEALERARSVELDLFVVSETDTVPIAKILDYGKYKFELSKKEKGQKKKQSGGESKEIKMRYNIDIGDYNTRIDHAKKFLAKSKRVKLNITLRGREIQHSSLAIVLAKRFVEDLIEYGTIDGTADKMTGRSIIVYIVPGADKQKIKKKQEEAARQEKNNVENSPELQDS